MPEGKLVPFNYLTQSVQHSFISRVPRCKAIRRRDENIIPWCIDSEVKIQYFAGYESINARREAFAPNPLYVAQVIKMSVGANIKEHWIDVSRV
jgi:hypothetical protein